MLFNLSSQQQNPDAEDTGLEPGSAEEGGN